MGLMRLGEPGQEIPVAREHGKYLTCAPYNRYRRRLPRRKRNICQRRLWKRQERDEFSQLLCQVRTVAGSFRMSLLGAGRAPRGPSLRYMRFLMKWSRR